MHHHFILKAGQRLPEDLWIPDWVSFATDKSVVVERMDGGVDHLFDEYGLRFWLTREYRPASTTWSPEEVLHGLDRTYRLILQRDYDIPPNLLARIRLLPSVDDARELTVRDAPLPDTSMSLSVATASPHQLINLGYAQAITKGNPQVRIAVLDTGVNLDHPELQGRIARQADFVDLEGLDTSEFIGDIKDYDDVPEDEVGHGTHVSGIIAARGLRMDEGVAPGCSLMAVRVLATMRKGDQRCGAGIVDNINVGIKWAVDNGADVINMSLGIKHEGGGLPHEDVIRYALSKNVTVVAASGNDGQPSRYYPGALPGVIAVGAVDGHLQPTPFTSYGALITVAAPGVAIYSSFAHEAYAVASGTSQASPFVAGMIGLLKSFAVENGTTLSSADVLQLLRDTSDRVDTRFRTERAGYGVINAADAFKLLAHSLTNKGTPWLLGA